LSLPSFTKYFASAVLVRVLSRGFLLAVAALSHSNVTDEQYFLQQDGAQEPSGNPTNAGGETTHARKEITPGKCIK
jgi:hypothetical protein